METERHSSIYNNLAIKPTEELLSIWQDEEDLSWEDIVYEFIEQILQERHIEIPPRSKKVYAQEFVKKSKTAFDQGDTDQALDFCEQALELKSDLAEAYRMRGMISEELEEYERALSDYRKAVRINPRLSDAKNKVRELEFYLESLIETEDYSEELENAVNLAYEEKFDEALEICNTILRKHPDSASAYNDRGVIYDEMGEKNLALADYRKAVQLDSTNEDACDNLRSLSGELDETYEPTNTEEYPGHDLDSLIEIEDFSSELQKAVNLAYEEKFDEALEICNLILLEYPDFAGAYNDRGVIYDEMGEKELALADYRKAVQLDSTYEDARENLRSLTIELDETLENSDSNDYQDDEKEYDPESVFDTEDFSEELNQALNLAYEKQFNEALEICNAILLEHPNLAGAYNDRGVIYDEMDEKELALADYRKAVQLDSTYEDARENLRSLSKEYDEAFEFSDTKIQLDHALEYIYEEEFDTAFEICRNVKPDLPALAIAHNYYGLLMESMGKLNEAVDAYKLAIEINPTFSAGFDNLRNARWKLEAQTYHRAGLENITCDPADANIQFTVKDGFVEDESMLEDLPGWFYLDEQAYLLKGWTGYRSIHSSSGMDPLQNEFENARTQGVMISWLFNGKFRTDNPFFLLMMIFIGGIMASPILSIFTIPTDGLEMLPLLLPTTPYVFVGLVLLWNVFYSLFNEATDEAIERGDQFY